MNVKRQRSSSIFCAQGLGGSGAAGEPSPIMVTFLNMATSTVYKVTHWAPSWGGGHNPPVLQMAGLGAFKGSQTYKTVMGEKEEVEEKTEEDRELQEEEEEEEVEYMYCKATKQCSSL